MASITDLFGPNDKLTRFIFDQPTSGGDSSLDSARSLQGISQNPNEFVVDVTSSFVTNLGGSVSDFPIEDGSSISDHFQRNPLTVTMKGFISEDPSELLLNLAAKALGGVVANQFQGLSSTFASAAVAGFAGLYINGGSTDPNWQQGNLKRLLMDRDKDKKNFPKRAMLGLAKFFRTGTPFTIRSYFDTRLYNNMVITSLSFPQTGKIGDSLEFNLTAKQITLTKKFSTTARELRAVDPIGSSAASELDKGTQTTKPKRVKGSSLFEAKRAAT